jgi:hypothetical protein
VTRQFSAYAHAPFTCPQTRRKQDKMKTHVRDFPGSTPILNGHSNVRGHKGGRRLEKGKEKKKRRDRKLGETYSELNRVPLYVPVNGADIVKPAAGNEVTRRSIGTSHDPRGSQWNGVHLVSRIRVPDDELAVLTGADQIPACHVK